jgi:hypothetical protein
MNITEQEGSIIALDTIRVQYRAWIKDGETVESLEVVSVNHSNADEIHPALVEGFKVAIIATVENNL